MPNFWNNVFGRSFLPLTIVLERCRWRQLVSVENFITSTLRLAGLWPCCWFLLTRVSENCGIMNNRNLQVYNIILIFGPSAKPINVWILVNCAYWSMRHISFYFSHSRIWGLYDWQTVVCDFNECSIEFFVCLFLGQEHSNNRVKIGNQDWQGVGEASTKVDDQTGL